MCHLSHSEDPMGCLPRTATGVEWSLPKSMTQVLHAVIGRDLEASWNPEDHE